LVGLFFEPEGGGDVFLRNIGWLSTNYYTWRYIPEDRTLRNHRCENPKFNVISWYSSEKTLKNHKKPSVHIVGLSFEIWTLCLLTVRQGC
jgi:hypothetical protein